MKKANYNMKNERIELPEVPFKRILSLEPLIEYWENIAKSGSNISSTFARFLLAELDKAPELKSGIEDFSLITKQKELVDGLMSVIYPPAQLDSEIAASILPFEFKVFYSTDSYNAKLGLTEEQISSKFSEQRAKAIFAKTMKAYSFILNQVYGINNNAEYPIVFNLPDQKTGLHKYFQLTFDGRFMGVKTVGAKPELSENCVRELLSEPTNLKLWMEKLPPEKFEIYGFTTVRGVDITNQEIVSKLKHDLLESESIVSPERFSELERKIKSYFNSANVRLGLAYMPAKTELSVKGQTIGNSFILNNLCRISCGDLSGSIYDQAFKTGKVFVIEDIENYPDKTIVEKEILKLGIKSIMAAPLFEGENFIGMLEIGSSVPGEITAYDKFRIREILGLFTIAVKRTREEYETKIQAVIKEECTAIHPVVEWRFVEASVNLIENRRLDKNAEMENIIFENVYPLYGVSDIRNSSQHRNDAISHDLIEHLRMAQEIVRAALKFRPMPILEEFGYRLSKHISNINKGLNSGDEVTVMDFLHYEIDEVFNHLKGENDQLQEMINSYYNALDPEMKSFHDKRKDYESSVSIINETISNFLDDAEKAAQQMFPHYFEKYKTDGVEHSIYIGASLVNDRTFDMMYLHNLRLWQLITMCGIVRKTDAIQNNLKIPLQTSHLILVQHSPLSIRFRQDEKKFDVDGTYNIRYEIMKKRIDKAVIADTSERLTQPGKIAIVYSQNKEAAEYKKYVEFLQVKGYLKNEVEYLNLESLQGVSGLRAIRVTVNNELTPNALSKTEVDRMVEVASKIVN